jgi:hypothetical protein
MDSMDASTKFCHIWRILRLQPASHDWKAPHLCILQRIVRVHRLAIDLGRLHVVAHIRVHMVRKVYNRCALSKDGG